MSATLENLEKATIARILHAREERRAIQLDDLATCIVGPFAHELLHVRAIQPRRGIAMVTVGKWPGVEEVPLADLYHFMDYFQAVLESLKSHNRRLH